jgi:hypothetical protein
MSDWQDISTVAAVEGLCAIVDDGERIGEAVLHESYGWSDDDCDTVSSLKWRWANHGSCGCCWGDMDPQPLRWQPLPERGQ